MKIKPVEKSVDTLIMEISTFYNDMLDASEDETIEPVIEVGSEFYEKIKNMSSGELYKKREKHEEWIKYTRDEAHIITYSISQIKAYNDSAIAEETLAKVERTKHQKATAKNKFEKTCLPILTVGAKAFKESKKGPLTKQALTYDLKSILTYGIIASCFLNPLTAVGVTLLLGYLGVRQVNRIYHEKCMETIDNRINRLHTLYDNGEKQKAELLKDREEKYAVMRQEELCVKAINEELDKRASIGYSSPVLTSTKTTNKVYQYHK